jgi:hypothetical protein
MEQIRELNGVTREASRQLIGMLKSLDQTSGNYKGINYWEFVAKWERKMSKAWSK